MPNANGRELLGMFFKERFRLRRQRRPGGREWENGGSMGPRVVHFYIPIFGTLFIPIDSCLETCINKHIIHRYIYTSIPV